VKYLKHHRGFGGERIVSEGCASPERFVRAATLIKNIQESQKDLISVAFRILDEVKQNDTQWSIVYDITERQIHFRTKRLPEIKSLRLSGLDFNTNIEICNVNTKAIEFSNFSIRTNTELLEKVFGKFTAAGEMSNEQASSCLTRLIDYSASSQSRK
jgi:choloylglycine hydrolase